MPDSNTLKSITEILEKFVKGKLNLANERLYTTISQGGLGLIKPEDYLISQQVMWIKRAFEVCCDNWRCDIWDLSSGNPLCSTTELIRADTNPILCNIVKSFEKFRRGYTLTNNNYKKSLLLYNPAIIRGQKGYRYTGQKFC
jgi:hypothetical protein